MKYGLLMPPDSTVQHARKELSKLCGVAVENLLLAEVVGYLIKVDDRVSFRIDFSSQETI